jgi:hypothetical protein
MTGQAGLFSGKSVAARDYMAFKLAHSQRIRLALLGGGAWTLERTTYDIGVLPF